MRRKIALFILLVFVFVMPAFAQENAQPIAYGDVIEATQQSDDGDYWTFEGAEGDIIAIQMSSEDFDTYLELLDEDGDLIVFNDDSADLFHSLIVLELEEDGVYHILARSYGENAEGEDYLLALALVDSDHILSYGDEVEGRIESDAGEIWVFDGVEGEIVTISMDSDIVDTYLELYNPDGFLVALNDDSGGTLDSEITNFELEEDGYYVIHATTFATASNGAYTLTLEGAEGGEEAAVSGEVQGAIELGTVVEGNITTGDGDLWTFSGEEDDIVLIAMNSPSTDCYLDLFGADGEYILRDDDSGVGFNAAIIYELPEDGEYTVITRGYAGQTGQYRMSVVVLEDLDEIIYGVVSSSNNVNLRDGANGDVVDSTYSFDFFLLVGRSEDGAWLQIASIDDEPLWISASVVDPFEGAGSSEDFDDLPVTG
jgi:hypothetical protein